MTVDEKAIDALAYKMANAKLGESAKAPPGEAVGKWQWRSRIKGGAWDAWEQGRFGQEIPPFADVEERFVPAPLPDATAGGVAVKALDWHKSHMTPWDGDYHTLPTAYSVRCADENGWKWQGLGAHGYASSPEGAQAEAQRHHETRIRSALVPAAGGVVQMSRVDVQMALSALDGFMGDTDPEEDTPALLACQALSRALTKPLVPAGGVDAVREVLEWYAEQGAGCRKLGHIGDPFRQALDKDGGNRATAAIASLSKTAPTAFLNGGLEAARDNVARSIAHVDGINLDWITDQTNPRWVKYRERADAAVAALSTAPAPEGKG